MIFKFDDYCAPILHCAGVAVEVVHTDSEGHARRYVEEIEVLPDALLIAGGDGTVSEAVTGFLRRAHFTDCPIGVLPVGRTNTFAKQIFEYSNDSNLAEVNGLANATIAAVRSKTTHRDVIKIEPLSVDSSDAPARPIFALGNVQWGAYRDALSLRDKYWYTGPLREYTCFLFNAFGDRLTWNCSSQITYSAPCPGCSNCFNKPKQAAPVPPSNRRWWSSAPKSATAGPDFSKVQNPTCSAQQTANIQASELLISQDANRLDTELPRLVIQLGRDEPTSVDFLRESWTRVHNDEFEPVRQVDVRAVEIRPEPEVLFSEEKEAFFSIDNEAYEVKPVRISVVPRALRMITM